jgi:predicted kinase
MLYIPIGIPGCGKSFLAEQMVVAKIIDKYSVISSDQIRVLLTGDINCQSINSKIFGLAHSILETRLSFGQDCYLDATNLIAKDLKKAIQQASSLDDVLLIISDTPDDVALARNARRERTVPAEAMEKFIQRQKNFDLPAVLREFPVKTVKMSEKLEEVGHVVFDQIFPPDEPVEPRETPVKAPRILNSFVPAWLPLEPPFDA